ncbi:virulence associated protein [Candidatus Pacearchaeota archaeon]|nr:virulence associated protein [Candidatus Pacearchaeota archaeon]
MLKHLRYYSESTDQAVTQDGVPVKVIELNHDTCEKTMSEWANHLRSHYCVDALIDKLRDGTGLSRAEYLRDMKLPSKGHIKSGDFAEILVSDYFQFLLGFEVPRTRYQTRINKDVSSLGVDIIGFKKIKKEEFSTSDELITCEVKAALSNPNLYTLQNALNDSIKDYNLRKAESLNAMKQRLIELSDSSGVLLITRFQNKADNPYKEISGSAAVHSTHTWEDDVLSNVQAKVHPNKSLLLIVIRGIQLMDLVNQLYVRACDEA